MRGTHRSASFPAKLFFPFCLTHEAVALLVYKPGRQPRLWLQVPPKGEAETGQWASDGWTVVLADAHGKPLATRTLQTTACPEAAE